MAAVPVSNAGVAGPQSQSLARLFQGHWAGIGPASWSRNKFFAEFRFVMRWQTSRQSVCEEFQKEKEQAHEAEYFFT
jgi:hypothetical protein